MNGRGVAEEKGEEDQRPLAEKNHFRDGKAVTDAVEHTVEENGENDPAQEKGHCEIRSGRNEVEGNRKQQNG